MRVNNTSLIFKSRYFIYAVMNRGTIFENRSIN